MILKIMKTFFLVWFEAIAIHHKIWSHLKLILCLLHYYILLLVTGHRCELIDPISFLLHDLTSVHKSEQKWHFQLCS